MSERRSLPRPSSLAVVLLWVAGLAGSSLLAQEVHLPLGDYENLRHRAFPRPEPEPEPPVPIAFEAVRLAIELDGDPEAGARVVQTLDVSLFGEGWQTLELPAGGTFLESDLGTLEGFLESEGDSGERAKLRLRGSGRHTIRLVAAYPVERDRTVTRETRHLSLYLPDAAVVSGTLTAPPEIEEVEADDETLVHRNVASPGAREWSFLAEPGGTLELTLLGSAQAPTRDGRPLRYEATSSNLLSVSRVSSHLETWIQARVLDGRIEAFEVPLPEGWSLVATEAVPPATWKEVDGKLLVEPIQPAEARLDLHLQLTGPARDVLESLLIEPVGASRTRFFTKVHVDGDGLANLEDAGSGSYLGEPPEDLPPGFATSSGALLRVTSKEQPPRWQVEWSEGAEVLAADVQRLLVDVLVGTDGEAFYQLWLEARSSGSPRLDLAPPPGFRAIVGGRDGTSLVPASAGGALALPLSSSSESQVLYLAGLAPLVVPDNDPVSIPLPSLSAPVRRVEVRILLPGDRRYELADPTRAGRVAPPPRTEVVVPQSNLSSQVAGYLTFQSGLGDRLAPSPPGFVTVEAVWNALSPELAPLVLEVDDRKVRKEWF